MYRYVVSKQLVCLVSMLAVTTAGWFHGLLCASAGWRASEVVELQRLLGRPSGSDGVLGRTRHLSVKRYIAACVFSQ